MKQIDATNEQTTLRPPRAWDDGAEIDTRYEHVHPREAGLRAQVTMIRDEMAKWPAEEPIRTVPADLEDGKRLTDALGFLLAAFTLFGVCLGACLALLWR